MTSSLRKTEAHLKTAYIYAELSHAIKRKVGAVLLRDDRIVSLGYNGTAQGTDNECEYWEGGVLKTKDEVLHAEENVIVFAARYGVETNGCSMVITHSPCMRCARLILQAGIKVVIYGEETRHRDAIEYLQDNKVDTLLLNIKAVVSENTNN